MQPRVCLSGQPGSECRLETRGWSKHQHQQKRIRLEFVSSEQEAPTEYSTRILRVAWSKIDFHIEIGTGGGVEYGGVKVILIYHMMTPAGV